MAIDKTNSNERFSTQPPGLAVGIDVEGPDNLPWSGDPRADPFYVDNFTGAEIAHCTGQSNPRLAFCGLWAAKEAAAKCGNEFAGLRPIDIEIYHDAGRRPMLRVSRERLSPANLNWVVSISYSRTACMAICFRGAGSAVHERGIGKPPVMASTRNGGA